MGFEHYDYIRIGTKKEDIDILLFRIDSPKTQTRYIVNVECYPNDFYAVKFYRAQDKKNRNKFKILTGKYEARILIQTCIFIMYKEIIEKYPKSSVGFIGEYSDEESKDKPSKRYSVYSRLAATFVSDDLFEHYYNSVKSTYCLFRKTEIKKNKNLPNIVTEYFHSRVTDL